MKKSLFITSTAICLAIYNLSAQTPFNTIDSVNINQINAAVAVHGDLWWNPSTMATHCFFPNGMRKNIGFLSALWMSGYDAGNNLHIAAQTYRQNGNDYWPGPLNTSDTLTYATSHDWAKIWKVNRADIQYFQTLSTSGTATSTNTPAAIWTWPAKGNVHATGNGGAALTITDNMAPFVDVNMDGIYKPEDGDYPDVKGDQALWWVFSDNGPAHTETKGKPLGLEIHAMAYAYNRGTSIDRVVYYKYTIINKSSRTYENFRVGQFADMDLGTYNDDYIGYDSTRALAIIYNGEPNDIVYGANLPIAGIMMLGLTGGSMAVSANSFIYYNNDGTASGNPAVDTEYNNYLRSKFRGGMHLTDDYTVAGTHTVGFGSGPLAKFVFPGDPSNNAEWSECSSANTPGDRRCIIASGDITFNAGATRTLDMALVTTNLSTQNACGDPSLSFTNIKSVADTARGVYDQGGLPPNSVANISANNAINIYPNPAHDKLFIEDKSNNTGAETITIYNSIGQIMSPAISKNGRNSEVDISLLPLGLYNVLYRKGNVQVTAKFVKE